MAAASSPVSLDHTAILPLEMLSRTFLFLDLESIGRVAAVCKQWKTLQEENWKAVKESQYSNISDQPELDLSPLQFIQLHWATVDLFDKQTPPTLLGHMDIRRRIITLTNKLNISTSLLVPTGAFFAISHRKMPPNSFVPFEHVTNRLKCCYVKPLPGEAEYFLPNDSESEKRTETLLAAQAGTLKPFLIIVDIAGRLEEMNREEINDFMAPVGGAAQTASP